MTTIPSALAAVGIALALMYLPGLTILNRFAATRRVDGLSRVLIAPGVSAAAYVVLFAVCHVLGIRLGWWTPWAISLAAAGALLRQRRRPTRIHWPTDTAAYVTLLFVAIVLLASRLAAIKGLVAPLWGDSVHHTIIVQLMLDNGGLFQSWHPYDDAATFTYHFGFHASATMYAWMRGVSAEAAVLMTGQIANFCAVMGLYALTRLWTKSAWAGIFSIVVGGFISTYPYYFVYWGRYTQLTGHIILIAALVLLDTYLQQPRRRDNLAFLVVAPVVIAGLGMAQYKVAVLFVALSAALVVARMIRWYHLHRDAREALRASVGRAAALAGIAVLIFMTRGWDLVHGPVRTPVENRITVTISLNNVVAVQPVLVRLGRSGFEHTALVIWGVVLIGVCVIIVKRQDALWFVVGAGLCLIVMNPSMVGIRREGLVDEFHLALTVYIFAASVAGLAMGTLVETAARYSRHHNLLAATCCVALTCIAVRQLPPLPVGSVFVLPDDVQMMGWIRDNVPPDEKIAAPGFVTLESFTVGRDAGWWIPFYTRHRTNLMLMAAGQEEANDKRTLRAEVDFTKTLYAVDMSLPTSTDWFVAQGYRYFYIGAKPLAWKDRDDPADHRTLVKQLLRNPDWKVVHDVGEARLLEVMR